MQAKQALIMNQIKDTEERTKITFKKIDDKKVKKIIDNWPSHALGRSFAHGQIVIKDSRLKALSESKTSLPNIVPKPKFLESIERQIQYRLEKTGLEHTNPSMERLSIFKEAFDFIIGTFKTYRPILSAIKMEYDAVLSYYRSVARELGPTKELLHTFVHDFDQKLAESASHELKHIEELQARIRYLENKITNMKEARKTDNVTNEKLREKLGDLSQSLMRESDSRKLAMLDLNHLRMDYTDLVEYTKELNLQNQDGGDPVTLKIALTCARQAHTEALKKIAYLETEYVNVVPRNEYNILKQNLQTAVNDLERLKNQYEQLDSHLAKKSEELATANNEKEELARMFVSLQSVSTPRPDWSRIGGLVPGGRRRWKQISTGKSSKEKLVLFAAEITGTNAVSSITRTDSRVTVAGGGAVSIAAGIFPAAGGLPSTVSQSQQRPITSGLSTSSMTEQPVRQSLVNNSNAPSDLNQKQNATPTEHEARLKRRECRIDKIPKFLLGSVGISPRLFPKRDVLLLLNEIWTKRQSQLEHFLKKIGTGLKAQLPTFNDFLNNFFEEAFGLVSVRREWCLGLYTAGELMTDCDEIVRFRKIVDNEVDEGYHWYLYSLTGRLYTHLRERARATAVALTVSTTPQNGEETEHTEVAQAVPTLMTSNECLLTAKQLGLVLSQLFKCVPEHTSVIRLLQIAFADPNADEDYESVEIPVDETVSLDDLFAQVPGEPLSQFVNSLVRHLEQGRKAITDHIVMEVQRHQSGTSESVSQAALIEAMKIVRPEFDKIMAASPSCFFLPEKAPVNEEKAEISSGKPSFTKTPLATNADEEGVCELDETGATREEQALAWSRGVESEPKNYLLSTVNWLFQVDGTGPASSLLPNILEKRLQGANIKPKNRLNSLS